MSWLLRYESRLYDLAQKMASHEKLFETHIWLRSVVHWWWGLVGLGGAQPH